MNRWAISGRPLRGLETRGDERALLYSPLPEW